MFCISKTQERVNSNSRAQPTFLAQRDINHITVYELFLLLSLQSEQIDPTVTESVKV